MPWRRPGSFYHSITKRHLGSRKNNEDLIYFVPTYLQNGSFFVKTDISLQIMGWKEKGRIYRIAETKIWPS